MPLAALQVVIVRADRSSLRGLASGHRNSDRGAEPRGSRRNGTRPVAGLHALDALAAEPALNDYPRPPSVRGDLLMKLGRYAEAREELQRALAMTENRREFELLSKKLQQAMFID